MAVALGVAGVFVADSRSPETRPGVLVASAVLALVLVLLWMAAATRRTLRQGRTGPRPAALPAGVVVLLAVAAVLAVKVGRAAPTAIGLSFLGGAVVGFGVFALISLWHPEMRRLAFGGPEGTPDVLGDRE